MFHCKHNYLFRRSISLSTKQYSTHKLILNRYFNSPIHSQNYNYNNNHNHNTTQKQCTNSHNQRKYRILFISSVHIARFHHKSLLQHGKHGHHSHNEEEEHAEDEKHLQTNSNYLREKESASSRITVIGMICNIGLALFKAGAGILGNSVAMIADAVHSLSDLVTDAITFWAAKLSTKPKNKAFPYGHGRTNSIPFTANIL